ncbi:coiled-coil domain-containing protein 12-like [Mizuhopecten yessoensis]|uniref:Coiled-coil domain-containing protein 12 n=1 Tax=Mizuhopecten yessoensis TaxID=6573 RepID=A0A210QU34_MIZYE|nr:coiled-coil domain-containing protein 12-like [Mizuhopecten yessoensis]OWF52229.1 Coiled-coil domain-containing protein 12 [Mizuhopecten yessoensis]
MASVGSMEEAARKRKEKLRAMRTKQNQSGENAMETDEKEALPKPVFRSYKPQDESLKEQAIPVAKPADVTEKIKSQLEASTTKEVVEEVDIMNLAPRKPDWDLKRDVAKKLEKLEKRTQRAIAELIRERLKSSGEDLATMVNAAMTQNVQDDD